ncbi:MAG: hypothetical protein ACOH1H_03975 [Brevundimonas sp.]
MTSRVGLMALASLAGLALSMSTTSAETTPSARGYVLTDLLITSYQNGRPVATTRTDGRGSFRLTLPAGANNICLNGPSLRSAINRSSGTEGEDHIIAVLIGLLLPAVQAPRSELQLALPATTRGSAQDRARGPSPADSDLCFPYAPVAGPVPGDYDGDGRADRQVDPRVPPPAARAAPARPATPQTVAVTGTVSLVR